MFRKPLLIALDMDGTLCLTAKFLRDYAIAVLQKQDRTADLEWIENNQEMSTLLWPRHLRDITDEAVTNGSFMLNVEPSAIVEAGLFKRLSMLKECYEIKTVVCTHRGFHEQGKACTVWWLREHNGLDVMDEIHAIDPKDHPNKLDYLSALYPGYDIRLFDDNPLFRTEDHVHDRDSRLMIYEEEGLIPAYAEQYKVSDIRGLLIGLMSLGVMA